MLKNPLQYSISTLLFVTFLVAVGMTVGPVTWFLIAVIECIVFYGLLSCFQSQLPSAIVSQMKRNRFRADGSLSSRRETIEKAERKRFVHSVAVLLLLFFVATNLGLLVLRVDQVFEGELYLVDSPEVLERPGRKISQAQYASELGAAELARSGPSIHRTGRSLRTAGSDPIPPLLPDMSSVGSVRMIVILVVGTVWLVAALLFPIGYFGMLKGLASGAVERAERYGAVDYQREGSG